jgi:hypothetical protein
MCTFCGADVELIRPREAQHKLWASSRLLCSCECAAICVRIVCQISDDPRSVKTATYCTSVDRAAAARRASSAFAHTSSTFSRSCSLRSGAESWI